MDPKPLDSHLDKEIFVFNESTSSDWQQICLFVPGVPRVPRVWSIFLICKL